MRQLLATAWFWNHHGTRTGCSVGYVASDGGLVLIDPVAQRVVRTYGAGTVSADWVALRSRLERHVPSPRFSVEGAGRLVVEQFVHGEHLLDVPRAAQVGVVRNLFRCYTALTRHEAEGSSERHVLGPVAALDGVEIPERVLELVGRAPLGDLARTWPLVPSATDATPKNLLVVCRRTPVPIDLGNLRLDPFFSFPVGVVGMTRPHVLRSYLSGEFDGELRRLFDAARCELPPGDDFRELLLCLRVVMTSHRAASSVGSLDRVAFGVGVRRRWSAIETLSPSTIG